jgi:hypothetical protein
MSEEKMTQVGEIAPEIFAGVQGMRQRSTELLVEMGRLELTKQNILSELRRLENQSQTLLRQEADRLGIAEGASWHLTPEGKAMVSSKES